MKNTLDTQITEAVRKHEAGEITSDQLVAEALGFNLPSGTPVAITEDPTYPYSGQRGVTKGTLKGGLIEVELPNGTTVPMQASLLVPLRK